VSNSSKRVLTSRVRLSPAVLGLSAVAVLLTGLASAAVALSAAPTEGKAAGAGKPSSLRCWQHGRLILEEKNLQPQIEGAPPLHAFTQGNQWLALFAAQETLCLYESGIAK